jgi:hypothetical protein
VDNPQHSQPNKLTIYHSIRQDLTEEESDKLSKQLDAATISQEAYFVLEEMRIEAIESLANTPFLPDKLDVYSAIIATERANISLLTDLLNHFKDKIR